ncbi:hypothetical protein [Phenylobacterium sp.]|uniref:GumC family protein n=1 Tax=Phenylobacterium sp. TaxID=1871053 RepID=UPI0025CD7EC8|nr:hypothetical protein [Phenylobacterium sp.]
MAKLLRILRARYLIVALSVVGAIAGGVAVIVTSPSLYMARARVVLDLVRLDELTGSPISKDFAEPYIESQLHLLKDAQVTGRVAESLGWLANTDYVAQYENRAANDERDLRTWAGDTIASASSGYLLPESNVLEITYRSYSPEAARVIVDLLRQAFVEAGLDERRESAREHQAWFDGQARKLLAELGSLVTERERLQRETGIVLQDDTKDLESAKLKRLNGIPQLPVAVRRPGPGLADQRLSALDAQIAQLSATLGPNNPQLVALRQKRAAVALSAADERRALDSAMLSAISQAQALNADLQLQRLRVGSQAQSLAELRQIQDQITVLRGLYDELIARSDDLRQAANISETERLPVGAAEADEHPYFPNPGLILGGTTVFGTALGVTLALFVELLSRRVRGVTDLAAATDAPVLGVFRLAASRSPRLRIARPKKARAARGKPRRERKRSLKGIAPANVP